MNADQLRKAYDQVNGQSIVFITVGISVMLAEVSWLELLEPKSKNVMIQGIQVISQKIISQNSAFKGKMFTRSITKKSIISIERSYLKHKKLLFEVMTSAKCHN